MKRTPVVLAAAGTALLLAGIPIAVDRLGPNQHRTAPPAAVAQCALDSPAGIELGKGVGIVQTDCSVKQLVDTEWPKEQSPVVSPDGTKLVFVRYPDPNPDVASLATQLVVLDLENGREEVLIEGTPHDYYATPSWSPDGTKIAFARDDLGNGRHAIWAYDLTADKATLLNRGETAQGLPAWSPDGNSVVFQRSGDPSALVVVDATTGDERNAITLDKPLYASTGAWSPAGDQIAVWAFEGDGDASDPYPAHRILILDEAYNVLSTSALIEGESRSLTWTKTGIFVSVDNSIIGFDAQSLEEIQRQNVGGATYFN